MARRPRPRPEAAGGVGGGGAGNAGRRRDQQRPYVHRGSRRVVLGYGHGPRRPTQGATQ